MEVWEAQYGGDKAPLVPGDCYMEVLAPRIRALDLVVFRLCDSHGRATPLMRHAAWQYAMEVLRHPPAFGCFERVGIEWHPSWGTMGGRGELRSGNFEAIVNLMGYCDFPTFLYWLVDGMPRPNWKRDYPAVIVDIFAEAMARKKEKIPRHLRIHWGISEQEGRAMLSGHHLDQEFEANGRRYYVVFVVFSSPSLIDLKRRLDKAGVVCRCPFPGGADLWPEAIREPVRLAHDVMRNDTGHMGTMQSCSYILSWEPI